MRVLLALVAMTSIARADLFDDGQALYTAGKYREAIEKFEAGYKLAADPVYLFNIAQSYRKLFDCVAASDYYNRYLAADKDPATAKQRERVKQFIGELEPCVAQRRDEIEKAKQAEAAKVKPIVVAPPSKPTEKRYEEVDRGGPLRLAGLALGGAGAIGIVVGIVYAKKGATLRDELAHACDVMCDYDDVKSREQRGERMNSIAKFATIGGGVALAVGAGLYVFGRMRVEKVEVVPTAGGATIGASLAF